MGYRPRSTPKALAGTVRPIRIDTSQPERWRYHDRSMSVDELVGKLARPAAARVVDRSIGR